MLKIPKLSIPLAKDIRTGEGVLEWATAVLVALAGVTGNLSFAHTGTYLTIVAGIKGIRRGLLKIVAVQKQVGLDAPVPFTPSVELKAGSASVQLSPDEILKEIAAVEKAASDFQAQAGADPTSLPHGLAPEKPTPVAAPAEVAKS